MFLARFLRFYFQFMTPHFSLYYVTLAPPVSCLLLLLYPPLPPLTTQLPFSMFVCVCVCLMCYFLLSLLFYYKFISVSGLLLVFFLLNVLLCFALVYRELHAKFTVLPVHPSVRGFVCVVWVFMSRNERNFVEARYSYVASSHISSV